MKKTIIGSIMAASACFVIGCGGGGTNPDPDNKSDVKKGYYKDSAVQGVKYNCGNREGITDKEGTFLYKKSDGSCTFSLAGVQLRTINTSDLINRGGIIIENNITVARFLQSLDFDGNVSNGITIDEKIKDELMALDLNEIPDTPTELNTSVVNKISVSGFKGKVPTDVEVKKHLEDTEKKAYSGSTFGRLFAGRTFYAVGQYNNDLTQTWGAEITFSSDLSNYDFTGLLGVEKGEKATIEIEHIYSDYDMISTKDGQWFEVKSFNDDYFDIEYGSNHAFITSHLRLYYDKDKALEYYNNLQKSVKNILNGKKFYIVYEHNDADGIYCIKGEGTFNNSGATFSYTLTDGTRGTKHLDNYQVNSIDVDGERYDISSISDKEIVFSNNSNHTDSIHLFYNKVDAELFYLESFGSSASADAPSLSYN